MQYLNFYGNHFQVLSVNFTEHNTMNPRFCTYFHFPNIISMIVKDSAMKLTSHSQLLEWSVDTEKSSNRQLP